MQFYDVIKDRESIKKFKNTEISKEKLARMIEATTSAPSWKNQISYKMILVDDTSKKMELSKTIKNNDSRAAMAVTEAPMVTVIVAQPDQSGEIDDKQYYLVDGAIALEHFVLAATNEGYGTCWIASFDEDKVRNILKIPSNFRVIAMTPLGEIGEREAHNEKKPMADHIFLNTWQNSYNNTTIH